mgnify:CR=1 FL=1
MVKKAEVDFVIAGVQKAGTRAMARFLSCHPETALSLPSHPEPHFFDWFWERDYRPYHAMFTPAALAQVTGDVTPGYLYSTLAMQRIHQYNPNMKIIVLLRNPVDRAYSQWAMQVETGRETRAFLPALLHEFRHFRLRGPHRNFSYVQRGFYDDQIARLQTYFAPEQYLILRSEDLADSHAATMNRVYQFLGVSGDYLPPSHRVHSRSYTPMSPYARRLLQAVFQRDIARLEARLGWDCSAWLHA